MSKKPSDKFIDDAIYLVDSSSFVFRAYYAIRAELTAPDGTPTHATYGFLQMVQALYQDYHAKKVILLWDQKEKGYRHEIFPEYKANRDEPPEDLSEQIESIREIFNSLQFPMIDAKRFEADDCIATLIRKNPKKKFVIVTADKDLLQLVNENVWCLDTLRRKWANKDAAAEKFGVEPEKIVEVQALCGDSVDNIPGAPGVGPKTAAQLINYYKDLDSVLKAAEAKEIGGKPKDKADPLKGKKIENLKENIDKVKLSLKLVALSSDAPIETKLEKLEFKKPKLDKFHSILERLGLQRAGERLLNTLGIESKSSGTKEADDVERSKPNENAEMDFVTIKNLSEFRSLLMSQRKEPGVLALDTETKTLDVFEENLLVGLCLSFDGNKAYYVPLDHDDYKDNLDKEKTLEEFRAFLNLTRPDFSVVFQNAKFDLHVLETAGMKWPWMVRVDDTMLASYVLDPTQKHNMDSLAFKYLDGHQTISFKDTLGKRKHFGEVPVEEATKYAAEDAAVTWRLWHRLSSELKKSKLDSVYERTERPLLPVLQSMERNGVKLDTKLLKKFSNEWHKELEVIEKEAKGVLKEFGVENVEELNIGSPKQLAKILFEDLELPVIKKGKTGPSTDVGVLEELAKQHPFPQYILEWRELQKLLSTYVDPLPEMINKQTKRLHTSFMQTIAATGRLSSVSPNLQNIPVRTEKGKMIREAFVADDDNELIGIDYSQVELRILAELSKDKNLVKAFKDGADIHTHTAALMFKKKENDVSSDERRAAKAINFGIIYGQTAFGLSKSLGISRAEAAKFIDEYKKTYPGIVEFMDKAVEEAKKKKESKSISGRLRKLKDIDSKNPMLRQMSERMAINTPIQGLAADIMKQAMIHVHEDLLPKYPKAKLLLQVHDELIFEAPKEIAPMVKEDAKKILESDELYESLGIKPFSVKLISDASIAHNWQSLK